MNDDHKNLVSKVIQKHFNQSPVNVDRKTIGTANEVYGVVLPEKEVIVRLSQSDKFLFGSHNHIPILKKLGIKVPEILAEDYSKTFIPYNYQIQSKIEGQDLDAIISTLTDEQLKAIAKEIATIFRKIKTIPADGKFGYIYAHKEDLVDTWTLRIQQEVDRAIKRGTKTGVMEDWLEALLRKLFDDYRSYFDTVKSETYFDDISSKNVMIHDGVFSGLVDLDCLAEGDYLEAVGRIKASWYGTHYGQIYTEAVSDELGLSQEQRKLVTAYALFNRIFWTCENGIQMNQNTKAVVDQASDKENKEVVRALAKELAASAIDISAKKS